MLSARDADMETKPYRRDGFTRYQQSRMKLLSDKSCTGVTESLVLVVRTSDAVTPVQDLAEGNFIRDC